MVLHTTDNTVNWNIIITTKLFSFIYTVCIAGNFVRLKFRVFRDLIQFVNV